MRSSDNPRASVAACIALLDRAWGKPEVRADIALANSAFAVVPETLSREEWLAKYGRPPGDNEGEQPEGYPVFRLRNGQGTN
jgi:hypothetical protein